MLAASGCPTRFLMLMDKVTGKSRRICERQPLSFSHKITYDLL